MTDIFVMAAGLTVTVSAMAAIVIFLRAVLKNRHGISRTAFVFLWLLIFIRACIPFGFELGIEGAESPLPGQMIYDAVYEQVYDGQRAGGLPASEDGILRGDPAALTGPEAASAVSASAPHTAPEIENVIKWLFIIWILGAVTAASIFTGSYISKMRQIKKLPNMEIDPYITGIFEKSKKRIGIKNVALRLSSGKGGAVYGIFRPVIVLGEENIRRSEMILLHELVHIKQKDNLKKAFVFAVLALYWFDPLMWISVRLMIRDMEMACDEKVLKAIGGEERRDYAGIILSSAQVSAGTSALSFFGESPVYERIKHILLGKKKQYAGPVICAVTAAFMILGCFLSPASALPDKVEEAIGSGISSSFEMFDVPGAEKYPVSDYGIFEGGAVFLQEKTDIGIYTFSVMDADGKLERRIDIPVSEGEQKGSICCDERYIYYAAVKNGEGHINRINRATGERIRITSADPESSDFNLFCGEGYLCWYEEEFLNVADLRTGMRYGIYETSGNQDYGAVLGGWTAYSYKDKRTGKLMIRCMDLNGGDHYETESLLEDETYSVYGSDRFIVYKEDYSKTQVYVFDRKTGETSSLWDIVPEELAQKLSSKPWGISLLEDHIIICGEGNQVYTVDLKGGKAQELISETEGIGYYSYKNSGTSVATMLYVVKDRDPETTGNIYIARIADGGK